MHHNNATTATTDTIDTLKRSDRISYFDKTGRNNGPHWALRGRLLNTDGTIRQRRGNATELLMQIVRRLLRQMLFGSRVFVDSHLDTSHVMRRYRSISRCSTVDTARCHEYRSILKPVPLEPYIDNEKQTSNCVTFGTRNSKGSKKTVLLDTAPEH